ncbi:hypothetical protein [Streptomyces sp. NBC_00572]|uniref:hypothetical protein n=1 Tax=Streptomyces sp. NBC_00572 TaxID=2903664 RepID=UPI00225254FD|nr:hypothetical protein [Streptomyces sp. NBC_00572]MCX4982712.1 hypothetical protein [Streptomyces sp. NBC_00572]
MHPRLFRPAAVLLMSAGLLLTACSAGEPAVSADPKPLSDPLTVPAAQLVYPLDPYKTTAEQIRSLEKAQDLLTADCMKRFGFTYRPPVRPAPRTRSTSSRYGVTDAATVARYGYTRPGVPAEPEPDTKPLPPAEQLALSGPPLKTKPGGGLVLPPLTLEESRRTDSGRTLNGQKVPVGGCGREGHLRLYAEKKNPEDLLFVFGMESEAFTRAQKSPKVAAAVKAWSACMAEKGYRVSDPMESSASLGLNPESPDDLGSAKAITIAKHDVACKKRTDLVALWYTAEVGFQKELMEKHAETLKQVKKETDERIKKAASVNGS